MCELCLHSWLSCTSSPCLRFKQLTVYPHIFFANVPTSNQVSDIKGMAPCGWANHDACVGDNVASANCLDSFAKNLVLAACEAGNKTFHTKVVNALAGLVLRHKLKLAKQTLPSFLVEHFGYEGKLLPQRMTTGFVHQGASDKAEYGTRSADPNGQSGNLVANYLGLWGSNGRSSTTRSWAGWRRRSTRLRCPTRCSLTAVEGP